MYKDNPQYTALTFASRFHEQEFASSLLRNSEPSGVLVDKDNVLAFFPKKEDADRVEKQLNLARVSYETLKEIAGAADGRVDAYTNKELVEIIMPLLQEMYDAGIVGEGEDDTST